MSALGWTAVGVAAASVVLGVIAVLRASELMSDMNQAPDKTVWGLLNELIALGRLAWHHDGSQPQAEHRLAWGHHGSESQSDGNDGR
jgi:multisubunit Na+/H+ antiporter MnhG subunit